ncbi:4-(cytidine 5'-diphospho)-2-C-methyl-D-erythritol kinase [Corynebacterium crudilactis]|uniref:4-diphosphocytidyl-2-C-methyl-D-erythritol kinase n=1 Tax=Corynebacterium crudilactis TaxID=1652495 RepID=A0A172QS99_9CORY|nr:4-(cytidine 5'-diphospho)-2-C-methyl-D-erythritol kinase [Corynebacterium crudilactis]ANE03548.1 4-(cytidine 5'-diphospho)-2-C-methyl-D-erythritol kinase [Corynebacterium crudilactis]
MRITAKAWAKTNLHLGVGPAREDGFHELMTVFQTIDLSDTVTLTTHDEELVEQGSVVKQLSVTGARGVPEDASNLAWRAVDALVARCPEKLPLPAVSVHIQKGIPVAGGMAGGSADAAATLRAVDAWIGPFGEDTLLEVAAELGSDVPFCLLGGTMRGTGRGEVLVDMLTRGKLHWVVAAMAHGLSTPEVFRKHDELNPPSHMDISALSEALLSGNSHEVGQQLHNDLSGAAFSLRPELRSVIQEGMHAGAQAGIVSGSGPTTVFLCDNAQQAQDIKDALLDAGQVYAAYTATGPAASSAEQRGAHILTIEK